MATRKRKATRKKVVARKRTRKNPTKSRVTVYKGLNGKLYAPRKRGRYKPTLRRAIKINPRRRRRNPSFSLKKVLDMKLLINAGWVAGGFIVGNKAASLIRSKVVQVSSLGKFSGVLNIGLGLAAASVSNRKEVKALALGVIAGGVTDIAVAFMPVAPVSGMLGADASMLGADASLLGASFSDSTMGDDDYYSDMD